MRSKTAAIVIVILVVAVFPALTIGVAQETVKAVLLALAHLVGGSGA